MNLLAIDTSTRTTLLGLLAQGRLYDGTANAESSHSRRILPSIDRLVRDAGITLGDLDAIVFGRGPGSFTGLRIAAGVVQGLGYGLGIPAVPVSSMACIAQSLFQRDPDARAFVALSARLREIYFGAYAFQKGLASPLGAEGVADVAALPPLTGSNWYGLGSALALRSDIEQSTGVQFTDFLETSEPAVEHLLALGVSKYLSGDLVDALDACPVYLREEVAAKPSA